MMNNQHTEQTYAVIKTYGIILKTYAHTAMNRVLHCKKRVWTECDGFKREENPQNKNST